VLQVGLIIAYVYLICLIIAFILRAAFKCTVDVAGRNNFLWLRNPIARERGIAAYRAWVPLERIRPSHISQDIWETTFAWPADNKPPYPPLHQQVLRGIAIYLVLAVAVAVALQFLTPFPVLTWLGNLVR
jgi:hypothetical protein